MKKIYLSLLSAMFITQMNAQLSLTQASHEPIVGDGSTSQDYDSVGVVPKTTGAAQTWDFNAFTTNTVTGGSSFVAPSSVPASTAHAGTTIVEDMGGSTYTFYKSSTSPSQFEMLGFESPQMSMTYTNSAIMAVWPINFGYSQTDTYAGTILVSGMNGPLNGTVTTLGSGSGNLVLPGGVSVSNILQVKTSNNITFNLSGGFVTGTIQVTDYAYYSGTQKMALMYVSYQKQTISTFGSPTVTTSADITMNTQIITGLNDHNFDASFQIFPNPAKNHFSVSLTNNSNQEGVIHVYNTIGQEVKRVELGNASAIDTKISIDELSSGIYVVKTVLGDKTSSRKLIIE